VKSTAGASTCCSCPPRCDGLGVLKSSCFLGARFSFCLFFPCRVQQDDSESVTTTTRIEFLEQELLRLRAAMEKEVAQRRESPIKTVPLDQEDAAAAAAVAAVAAAMANAAAAAAANEAAATAATPSTPSTPKSRPAQVPAPPPMPSALEVSDRPSPASFAFDGGLDYEHEEKAAQRRGSLICLQHIRSGVQLKKARKRRPSKKALAKSAKPEHKTIADLIRENNQKIGPAIRMYDDSPDQHEDDGWCVVLQHENSIMLRESRPNAKLCLPTHATGRKTHRTRRRLPRTPVVVCRPSRTAPSGWLRPHKTCQRQCHQYARATTEIACHCFG